MSDFREILSERYRPTTVEDCILPESILRIFRDYVQQGDFPHLLLTGSSGLGKTTVAKALCNDLGLDYYFVNASVDNGIDLLRTNLRDFCATVSLSGKLKVVIMDEADNMSGPLQQGLRGFLQEFSQTCRFIFTGNYESRIIPAIKSRTTAISFKFPREEEAAVAAKFAKRVYGILREEGIQFEKLVVLEMIKNHFPDFRRVLNEIDSNRTSGLTSALALHSGGDSAFQSLVQSITSKNFRECRQWLADHSDIEPAIVISTLWKLLTPRVNEVGDMILMLAECQKHVPFVADMELHLSALLVELMMNLTFKE